MNTQTFDQIRSIIYDASGICIQDGKESMISARLGQRLKRLEISNESEYLAHLLENLDREVIELLDVVSTNVTSFYREAEHFGVLSDSLVNWVKQGQRRFRIWCAASSTGEEPYTLAITTSEVMHTTGRSSNWRILATDISTRVLAEAQEGRYPEGRLKNIPHPILQRYFTRQEDSCFLVREELRSHIAFRRHNLSNPPFPMSGPLDAIFCRNVMIYFNETVRAPLIAEAHRLLKPGGLFVTGESESLTDIEGRFERAGPSIYRRLA